MHRSETLFKIRSEFRNTLMTIYDQPEIDHIFNIAVEDLLGWNRTTQVVKQNESLTAEQIATLSETLIRLKKKEPIQYIVGATDFFGLKLKVNSGTLIPRQETELLVREISRENSGKSLRILDIGTGTGCIALGLKKYLPKSTVVAMDISEEALETARINSEINKLSVEFIAENILDPVKSMKPFSLMVSNPPYVRNSERSLMHDNVLDYEPYLALFVEDDDPLIFYKAIARYAKENLTKDGCVWVEINEALGKETLEVFRLYGFSKTTIAQDLNGKDRFIKAEKNERSYKRRSS